MEHPKVVPMSDEHIHACIDIASEAVLETWSHSGFEDALKREDSLALVAAGKEDVIGFIIGRILASERTSEIYNIGVRCGERRAGIGGLLLGAFQDESRKSAVERIWLDVRASNTAAISFYAGHDFTLQSRRKAFYLNPTEDALLMVKNF